MRVWGLGLLRFQCLGVKIVQDSELKGVVWGGSGGRGFRMAPSPYINIF